MKTRLLAFLDLAVSFVITGVAQDRLRTMPGFDQYQKISEHIPGSVKSGALNVTWKDDSTFEYTYDGKQYRFDVKSLRADELANSESRQRGPRGNGPERGRQFESETSPDGKLKAFYRNRNLWLSEANGANEVAITTEGDEKKRIKYGVASWVYGEELRQNTAMWWSPNSKKIAFYRFDESQVPDYFLQLDQTKLQSKMDVEAYPKAGVNNPIADIFVYDIDSKKIVKLDVRDGKPFDNSVVGHYVYSIQWSPDGSELICNRTNRRQNIMEFIACNPETGKSRVIVREEWPASWTDNHPTIKFLKDGKRFIWESERTGWKNFYLYDLTGKLLATLTNHEFEVGTIVRIDEDAGFLYYMARDGENHMKLQLHRVGFDGNND